MKYLIKENSEEVKGYMVQVPFSGSVSLFIEKEKVEGDAENDSESKFNKALFNAALDVLNDYDIEDLGKDDRTEYEIEYLEKISEGNCFYGSLIEIDYYEESMDEFKKVVEKEYWIKGVSMSATNMSNLSKGLILTGGQLIESCHQRLGGKKIYADVKIKLNEELVEKFNELTGLDAQEY